MGKKVGKSVAGKGLAKVPLGGASKSPQASASKTSRAVAPPLSALAAEALRAANAKRLEIERSVEAELSAADRRSAEDAESEGRWDGLEEERAAAGVAWTVADDVLWVYGRMGDVRVGKLDAPSRGSWGLLEWARESPANRKQFYGMLVKAQEEVAGRAADEEKRAAERAAEELAAGLAGRLEPDRLEQERIGDLRAMLLEAVEESRLVEVDVERQTVTLPVSRFAGGSIVLPPGR